MPERVGDYYNLMPLDSSQANVPHKSRTFRYQTISYKATHIRTNAICYLKRIMGIKSQENCFFFINYIYLLIKDVNYQQYVFMMLLKHGKRLFMQILLNYVKYF